MAARRGRGLSIGQLVLLTLGFVVASGLVFLFGIWVGKDMAERRLAEEERVIRRPVLRPTPSKTVSRDPDLTLYENLGEATAPPAPSPKAATRTPTAARVPSSTASPTRATRTTGAATPTAAVPRPSPARVLPTLTPIRVLPPRAVTEEWADAGWTVQVSASAEEEDAKKIADGLRAKGYPAYTLRAPLRGKVWYRVRVGQFRDRAAALSMAERLRRNEGFDNAYVAAR